MRIRRLPTIPTLGWPAWLATLAAFALLCAAVAYWAIVLLAPAAPIAPPATLGEQQALPEIRLASQLFGVTPSGPAEAPPSNIVVYGILAAGSRGSAILGVDGQPPKAFAVGERIGPTQVVHAVHPASVVIDTGGMRSELAAPLKRDLSVLTSGAGGGRPSAATSPVPVPTPGGPSTGQVGSHESGIIVMPPTPAPARPPPQASRQPPPAPPQSPPQLPPGAAPAVAPAR